MPSEKHPDGCPCDKFACELRRKGVQVSPAGMTNHNRKPPESNARYNNWEKGLVYDERPGGHRMPVIDAKGDHIPIKRFKESGKTIADLREQQKAIQATSSPTS